jgi:hypothetical protein
MSESSLPLRGVKVLIWFEYSLFLLKIMLKFESQFNSFERWWGPEEVIKWLKGINAALVSSKVRLLFSAYDSLPFHFSTTFWNSRRPLPDVAAQSRSSILRTELNKLLSFRYSVIAAENGLSCHFSDKTTREEKGPEGCEIRLEASAFT